MQRFQIRNVNFLNNLAVFVADNVGKPISPFSISKYIKSRGESVTSGLIGDYLTYLCYAYVMSQANRFDIHGKTILDRNCKYYFEDMGIRNSLVGGTRQGDIEKLIETAVYQQLVRMGYQVWVGQLKAGEIDFVCAKKGDNSLRLYIQASYIIGSHETYEREFGPLSRIPDNYPKYVISMTPLVDKIDDNGITHLSLRRFLTQGLSQP